MSGTRGVGRAAGWGALLLVLAGLGAGCGGDDAPADEPDGEVETRLVHKGAVCRRVAAGLVVVRTADEWRRLWADAGSETGFGDQPPSIDFTRHMVLGAFLGFGPTGRDVMIDRVFVEGGELIATWVKRDRDGPMPERPTSPFYLVRVPASRREVVWREAAGR